MSEKQRKGYKVTGDQGQGQMHSTTGGSNAVEHALSNDLVLKCIFSHLRTPNLVRDCRFVNKLWNRVATEDLKKRSDAYVKLNSRTNFEALGACIKTSLDFPFREVSLKCDREDFGGSPEKWLEVSFVQQYSSSFTRLRLASCRVPDALVTDLLSGPFNHIVALTLDGIQRKKKSVKQSWFEDTESRFKLEKLKSVAIEDAAGCDGIDLNFLEALLQSCPNLERVVNFTNAHLHAVSTAGKLEAVKSLRICACINKDTSCPTPLGVETLIIANAKHKGGYEYDGPPVKFSCLEPLLMSNRATLRYIEVRTQVFGCTGSSNWPTMNRLTSVKLSERVQFPDSATEVFPVLEAIELGPNGDGDFSFCDFLWKEPLGSVTKLQIFSRLTDKDWECVPKIVPEVRHIFLDYDSREVHQYYWSSVTAVDFWQGVSQFKRLETLIISPIGLPETNLDELLTGIPESCLKKLRGNPELSMPTPEFVDAVLRERGSLASLPGGVKELILRFTLSDEVTPRYFKSNYPISDVAAQYGLNMVSKDLKIWFMHDHWNKNAHLIEKALQPISGRVTFGHWNAHLEQ